MRYCFWCGGRLPATTTDDLFDSPSESEKNEITRLLANVYTATDVVSILGPPDTIHEWGAESAGIYKDVEQWKRLLQYSNLCSTFILLVFEMPDGTITYAYCGKPLFEPIDPPAIGGASWWRFWRKDRR